MCQLHLLHHGNHRNTGTRGKETLFTTRLCMRTSYALSPERQKYELSPPLLLPGGETRIDLGPELSQTSISEGTAIGMPSGEVKSRTNISEWMGVMRPNTTSVMLQFSFRRFLNRGNRQKPVETRKPRNHETYS